MPEHDDIVPESTLAAVSEYLGQDIDKLRKKAPRFNADPCSCASCDENLTFLDFVKTAHATNQHSRKYMSAFFEQSRPMKKEFDTVIICGNCQTAVNAHVKYHYVNYCPIPR